MSLQRNKDTLLESLQASRGFTAICSLTEYTVMGVKRHFAATASLRACLVARARGSFKFKSRILASFPGRSRLQFLIAYCFAYSMRSKTGGGNGLGTRLSHFFFFF